ncbi:hypothetical protein PZ739_21800 [Pseudomonas kermanshahensis]|uniref:hypothetical protein n=1 Tax=Pseudomonas kermanshahensis TaxID=2745482 RepID=UPI0023DC2284|nr:hypothetical protein [Pseudomonas kermanshahensis]WEL54445.1 hypothetical protein PZ739_21800 [Pseudomonas kermanshahensis]
MRKLDTDQHRSVPLLRNGQYQQTTMVSESGAYTLLAHHPIPENRHLRWWLTHEVVAVLPDKQADDVEGVPQLGQVCWQSEPWVRMRDMPVVMAREVAERGPTAKRKMSWRECAQRALRLHGV